MRVGCHAFWANDQFNLFEPRPGGFSTDDRFTNRTGAGCALIEGDDKVTLDVDHLMITEPGGDLRIDEFSAVAAIEHTWNLDGVRVSIAPELGATLTGHVGGLELQNAFHELISPVISARTRGHGLQDRYEGGLRASPRIGATGSISFSPWRFLTLGTTAASRADFSLLSTELAPNIRFGNDHLFVSASVHAVAQYALDPRLSMRGGYSNGLHVEPELSVGGCLGPVSLSFSLRGNVGGSGGGFGTIVLDVTP